MVFVYKPYRFIEEDGVPSDSKVVGQEWAKTNKDGSRDKRFAGNYQIPIALYGELILKSATGLDEKFVVSNPERLQSDLLHHGKVSPHHLTIQLPSRLEPIENPGISASREFNGNSKPKAKIVGTDVHFECQFCKQPIEVNAEAAGQEFRCPGCGGSLIIASMQLISNFIRHQGKANMVFCASHIESSALTFLFADTSDAALARWKS